MTPREIVDSVNSAKKTLQDLFDYIDKGRIVATNGSLSYALAEAYVRKEETRIALGQLMVASMQYATAVSGAEAGAKE